MPIYKAKGKKEGLQKYYVRINYISDRGEHKQLTRVAYGADRAKDLERRLHNEIKTERKMPIKKMTLQELYNEYIAVKTYELRKTSIVKIELVFKYYVLPTFRNHQIGKISGKAIQEWKIYMEQKALAHKTKKMAFVCFSAMMNYAVKMEYINKNPLPIIGTFKNTLNIKADMNVYTPEEFKRFISFAKEQAEEKERLQNDLSEWNYYVFFNIAFYTGLRKGEIHALKWSDINGAHITVNRSITQGIRSEDIESAPKNKSSVRTLQMPTALIEALDAHNQRQKKAHNFADDFRICGNIRDTSIARKNKLYSTKAGLHRIRIHDYRHSHASLLANNSVNIQEISRRLGHTRIEITLNTYCHLYPKEEEKAVAVLNSIS
jgi:integrase